MTPRNVPDPVWFEATPESLWMMDHPGGSSAGFQVGGLVDRGNYLNPFAGFQVDQIGMGFDPTWKELDTEGKALMRSLLRENVRHFGPTMPPSKRRRWWRR